MTQGAAPDRTAGALLAAVFLIATAGLVYELVAGTTATYLLGDSVTQFSTVIGAYLSALGLGAWLSRFVRANVARRFVEVELAVALIGGASAPLLFFSFGYLPDWFRVALYGTVLVIGTLVGLEIHGEIAGIPQTKSLPGSFEVKQNLAELLHRMK